MSSNSLKLKTITLKNFLSTGQITQTVNFDSEEIVLILGQNLDIGGNDARNGVGKTTLIQALSYVLFDAPINKIKKNNLINRTNGKGMMVTLDYSCNGIDYRIERGRGPVVLKFYINSVLQDDSDTTNKAEDSAQGENKDTQKDIEKSIGMSLDMFRHIVVLNTHTEPFLGMSAGYQRIIIEQLLGITLLSEKAEAIRVKSKAIKERIENEQFKIKTLQESNKRVEEQIENLRRRQRLWQTKHNEDLNKLTSEYSALLDIDIDAELDAHVQLAVYNEKKRANDLCDALLKRQVTWKAKNASAIMSLQVKYDELSHIDIDAELDAHRRLVVWNASEVEIKTTSNRLSLLRGYVTKDTKTLTKLKSEIDTLEQNKCYACGQDFCDEGHVAILTSKKDSLNALEADINAYQVEITTLESKLSDLQESMGDKPSVHYPSESEAVIHNALLSSLQEQIDSIKSEIDPYADQISEACTFDELGEKPVTVYESESQAIEHRGIMTSLETRITQKSEEVDPYAEQIHDMKSNTLQEIDFDTINDLNKTADHLKFLLDILTSKDSFVRKKIIDQSLSYLNSRLTHYLEDIGLPHTVVFQNDLTVEITEHGRDLDFHNLSRGEMNRLILALSWAFRDVWENLYTPINIMVIDELLDNGTDAAGMENSLSILKDMNRRRNKSIWLISHKDELSSRVSNVLSVTKQHGFTTYEMVETDKAPEIIEDTI